MRPEDIAQRDQEQAAMLAMSRETCQQRGHWWINGRSACFRCGDSKTDSNPTPQWYQELFGVDS